MPLRMPRRMPRRRRGRVVPIRWCGGSPDTVPSLTRGWRRSRGDALYARARGAALRGRAMIVAELSSSGRSPRRGGAFWTEDGETSGGATERDCHHPRTRARKGLRRRRLAGVAEAAVDRKPGERACDDDDGARVVAGTLRDLEGDEDPPHLLLREKLEADAAWQAFVGEEGAMAKFDAEQSGRRRVPRSRGESP